jgi:hypothetical protein
MAGYSKRSLVEKLGIKPGFRIRIINPPKGYEQTLGELPPNISESSGNPLDFIQYFTTELEQLGRAFPDLKEQLAFDGQLWISWPKKAAKAPTDLDENIIRDIGLQNGLVDVKIIAVDEVWAGLKFVYRVKDRK